MAAALSLSTVRVPYSTSSSKVMRESPLSTSVLFSVGMSFVSAPISLQSLLMMRRERLRKAGRLVGYQRSMSWLCEDSRSDADRSLISCGRLRMRPSSGTLCLSRIDSMAGAIKSALGLELESVSRLAIFAFTKKEYSRISKCFRVELRWLKRQPSISRS